jgi:iron complex outermembrane receptor protein
MFYSMYATAYDPAGAALFSVTPETLQLTSTRLYETGAKQTLWDGGAEWTVATYDIKQRNVLVPVNTTTVDVAGEVASKGVELAAAVRPIDGLKLWGNAAFTHARFVNFDVWSGNTPPNVAPLIVNAGASYRFKHWPWPVEFGGSVRHVGNRYLFPDDATTLLAYARGRVHLCRHSRQGSVAAGNREPAPGFSRAQPDQRRLCAMGGFDLPGSGSAWRAAHLRGLGVGKVVSAPVQ